MEIRLLENYKVMLFSFFAASLFWFVVVTENDYQYDINVQVKPVNLPADKIILNDLPQKARVRFRGRGKSLFALRFSNEAVMELNLNNVSSSGPVAITDNMIHVPRMSHDIRSWQVLSPDTIYVQLAQLRKKPVPVVPQINVEPINGYTIVGGVQVTPDSITISGPEKYVETVQKVFTLEKSFKKAKYRITGKVKLKEFPNSMKIRFALKEVRYEVDVQKLLEIQVNEIPVRVIHVPKGWKVSAIPSTLSLTVVGGERLLMQLSRDDFKAYIDYSRVKLGRVDGHPASVQAPPEITVASIRPERFKLASERQFGK